MSTIWSEKHRPSDFSEIKGQENAIKRIEALVKSGNLPHLLLAGPAGTGKTTTALVIAKKLYGENYKFNFIELNASDERGIDVVRSTIKDFARTKALGNYPFKLILLDECDSLTKEAQQALRRTMETFVDSARFLLSCNYSSKIIDPIQSRCAVFRFRPLNPGQTKEIMSIIAEKEGLTIQEDAVNALHELCNGDVRKLTNLLQSCASESKNIDTKIVYDIISAAEPKEVEQILSMAIKGDFINSKKLLLDTMIKHGLSGLDIIRQIQKGIWALNLNDNSKVDMIEKCGEIEFRMVEGSDEFVQLEALLATFFKYGGQQSL